MDNLIHEVRNDYTDTEDNCTRIDVWTSSDDNAEGFTVAVVCQDTGKVIWFKTEYINSEKIKQAIEEVKPKTTVKDLAKRLLNELPYEDDNMFEDAAAARQVRETIEELKPLLN